MPKNLVRLALALVFSIIGLYFGVKWNQNRLNQEIAKQLIPVVVANNDLAIGQVITPNLVHVAYYPKSSGSSDSVDNVKKLDQRIVANIIYKNEPINQKRLAPEGTQPGLVSQIHIGMRAITIKVNEATGLAGFISPENYVDLYSTIHDQNRPLKSQLILQNIRVLATGQEVHKQDNQKPELVTTVTLEVTPSDANTVNLANQLGTLSLALRNNTDKQIVKTSGDPFSSSHKNNDANSVIIIRGYQQGSLSSSMNQGVQ